MQTLLRIAGAAFVALALVPLAASAPPTMVTGAGKIEIPPVVGTMKLAVHVTGGATATDAVGRFRVTTQFGSAVAEVSCLLPVGERLVLGGIIVEATIPAQIGFAQFLVLEDGSPAVADRVAVFFGGQTVPCAEQSYPSLDTLTYRPLEGNFVVLGG